MRALPVQNRSTTMWLLGGLGVLVWVALSMLLSGSPASASQTPVTSAAASAPTIAKANPGQGNPGHGQGQQNANRGNGNTNPGQQTDRGHQAPAVSHQVRSNAAQPAPAPQPVRKAAVKAVQAAPAPASVAPKPGHGNAGADAQGAPAVQSAKAFKAAPQRFAENPDARADRFIGHVDNSGHDKAGIGDSRRGDRGWHGHHPPRAHTPAAQAHKSAPAHTVPHATPRTHPVAAAAPQQEPVAPQSVSAAAKTPTHPASPLPVHHTGNQPPSTAAQTSGTGASFALEAEATKMPLTPAVLLLEHGGHVDEVLPAGPAESTESFPD